MSRIVRRRRILRVTHKRRKILRVAVHTRQHRTKAARFHRAPAKQHRTANVAHRVARRRIR